MSKKKILIFIDWYVPGYKAGGPIQSVANLVAHLKDEFDFYIVTCNTDYCETTPYPNVKSDEWNVLSEGVNVFYFSQSNLNRNSIRNLIRQTTFDFVYLNGIFSIYFSLIPLLLLRKRKGIRIVIAARGMLAESALNVKRTKKYIFLRSVKVLRLFDEVVFHASTQNEKKDIQKVLGDNVKIIEAGNLPQKIASTDFTRSKRTNSLIRLINIARVAPEKNLLYALKVLQKVTEEVVFDFYGPIYDNNYWNECKEIMNDLPLNISANYKGSLDSGNVLLELLQADFMFMPTRGENFGHIILQSLTAGCPVIISDQTPWKDLTNKHVGWDISLDTIDEFAKTINNCARMSIAEREKMSQASIAFAKMYIENPEIVKQNRQLFNV